MSKKSLYPYTDDLQLKVERHWVNGCSAGEISRRLKISAEDAAARLDQLEDQYLKIARHMDPEWAKVGILKNLRASSLRCETIQSVIESRQTRNPNEFPKDSFDALRQEQATQCKILRDFYVQAQKREQEESKRKPLHARGLPQGDAARAAAQRLLKAAHEGSSEEISDDTLDDLQVARTGVDSVSFTRGE